MHVSGLMPAACCFTSLDLSLSIFDSTLCQHGATLDSYIAFCATKRLTLHELLPLCAGSASLTYAYFALVQIGKCLKLAIWHLEAATFNSDPVYLVHNI